MLTRPRITLTVAICLLFVLAAQAEIEIVLNNDFIDKYKNRVTFDANYIVDKAHKDPNPGPKDGDLHIAGRASEIQLPTVAEIMNAISETRQGRRLWRGLGFWPRTTALTNRKNLNEQRLLHFNARKYVRPTTI
jgi:hypothetical protein